MATDSKVQNGEVVDGSVAEVHVVADGSPEVTAPPLPSAVPLELNVDEARWLFDVLIDLRIPEPHHKMLAASMQVKLRDLLLARQG